MTSGTSDDSATSGGTTTGEPEELVPAHGIEVSWVEANQGIGVRIGENGEWVGPSDRTAYLLQNRVALIRAFWELSADYEPREILAQLTIEYPDGTTEIFEDQKLVDGEAFIGELSQSFFFGLMPEQAVPGIEYRVDLYEVEDGYEDAPNPSQGLPRDGSTVLVGIEDSSLRLDIVVVPVDYNDQMGCDTLPDTSDDKMQLFYDLMYQMNPVDTLNMSIHEPISFDQEVVSLAEINALLVDLRIAENAPPGTYYYGLMDACKFGVGPEGGFQAAGLANGIPNGTPTMEQAFQRVSTGLYYPDRLDLSAETFVHEVGHCQGRTHVLCSGEERGVDVTYPEEGGNVGEWGFGVIDFGLRHPTVHKDYMTYCTPTWVSTYGWNKVVPTIEVISEWPTADIAPAGPRGEGSGALLVGTILPDGSEIWQTVPGGVEADGFDPEVHVSFSVAGREVALQGAEVTTLPDSEVKRIVAPLPEGFDAMDGVTLVEGNQRRPIDRSQMRLWHWAQ